MKHAIHRVTGFQVVGDYVLAVLFADGRTCTIDFLPVLAGDLYGPLRNLELFNRVVLDSEVHTLIWPNGADFEPAILHDWPIYEQAFRERAKQWDAIHR